MNRRTGSGLPAVSCKYPRLFFNESVKIKRSLDSLEFPFRIKLVKGSEIRNISGRKLGDRSFEIEIHGRSIDSCKSFCYIIAVNIAFCLDPGRNIYVSDLLYDYAANLVEATRESSDIAVGASPRALLAFVSAAKALAFVRGRNNCIPDDFKELAVPVLAHRLTVRSHGALSKDGKFISKRDTAAGLINGILGRVPCPTEDFSTKI